MVALGQVKIELMQNIISYSLRFLLLQVIFNTLADFGLISADAVKLKMKELRIAQLCSKNERTLVQVNLFQKHLFLQQITNNMKKECLLIYQFLHENCISKPVVSIN